MQMCYLLHLEYTLLETIHLHQILPDEDISVSLTLYSTTEMKLGSVHTMLSPVITISGSFAFIPYCIIQTEAEDL